MVSNDVSMATDIICQIFSIYTSKKTSDFNINNKTFRQSLKFEIVWLNL